MAFALPQISFGSLVEHGAVALAHLRDLGAFAVVDVPGFAADRRRAFDAAPACMLPDPPAQVPVPVSHVGQDGVSRTTLAHRAGAGDKLRWPDCASVPTAALRAQIDAVGSKLFGALGDDKLAKLMDSSSEHLEHLHVYYRDDTGDDAGITGTAAAAAAAPSDGGGETTDDTAASPAARRKWVRPPTVDVHTDHGVMLAFTAGEYYERHRQPSTDSTGSSSSASSSIYSGAAAPDGSGLFISLPGDNLLVRATFPSDAIVFMVGDGAAKWFGPDSAAASLRPVPHALMTGIGNGQQQQQQQGKDLVRTWFGKMWLPPADMRMRINDYNHNKNKNAAAAITFGEYRDQAQKDALRGRRGLKSTACVTKTGEAGQFCWMQCLALDCGGSATPQCVEKATGVVVDGNTHCPSGNHNCELRCPANKTDHKHDAGLGPSSSSTAAEDIGFCAGVGVDMHMDGFHSLMFDTAPASCLNLLFVTWTLDSAGKFVAALFGVFLAAILSEAMTAYRRKLSMIKGPASRTRKMKCGRIALHVAQVAWGYLLMLLAMTYNLEVFLVLCGGLASGHAFFNLVGVPAPGNTDPCCAPQMEIDDQTEGSPAQARGKMVGGRGSGGNGGSRGSGGGSGSGGCSGCPSKQQQQQQQHYHGVGVSAVSPKVVPEDVGDADGGGAEEDSKEEAVAVRRGGGGGGGCGHGEGTV